MTNLDLGAMERCAREAHSVVVVPRDTMMLSTRALLEIIARLRAAEAALASIGVAAVEVVEQVAAAIWGASSAFGLARSWDEESLPVRQGFEVQARAALAVLQATNHENGSER